METLRSAQKKLRDEILGDSQEEIAKFHDLLEEELEEFTIYVGHAVVDWLDLDSDLRDSARRSLASGLITP